LSIKAVVFDYGRVISLDQDPKTMDTLARLAGTGREELEKLIWNQRGDFDRGVLRAADYYRGILSRLGIRAEDETIEKMAEVDLGSWKNVNPLTVKLMEEVKERGYKLGILSNMPREFLAFAREELPVFKLPQTGIFSCELGLIKPEAAIYRALLEALDVRAEETVFFDDMDANIAAAKELNIRAFLWKDPSQARRELAAWGVVL
jgi:putative hydrolase of the HAD superfamily